MTEAYQRQYSQLRGNTKPAVIPPSSILRQLLICLTYSSSSSCIRFAISCKEKKMWLGGTNRITEPTHCIPQPTKLIRYMTYIRFIRWVCVVLPSGTVSSHKLLSSSNAINVIVRFEPHYVTLNSHLLPV